MANSIVLEKVNMDIVKGGKVSNLTFVPKWSALSLNQVMEALVITAQTKDAESIIIPMTITVAGKDVQVGTTKAFADLAKTYGIGTILKPNFGQSNKNNNKGDDTMETNKTNNEVAASKEEEKKTMEQWAEAVKAPLTDVAETLKTNGFNVDITDADKILENYKACLEKMIKRGTVSPFFVDSAKDAEAKLATLKEIMDDAKEKGWMDTLKAIVLWVTRKVWALVCGIGVFAWDTLILTLNSMYAYGKSICKLAEIDIIDAVKNA